MATRDVAHCPHRHGAHASTLEVARHDDHERAEHVRAALVEAAGDRAVDSRREVLGRAVPAQRDGTRPREDLVVVADEVELEVRPLLGQARPVLVEDAPWLLYSGSASR